MCRSFPFRGCGLRLQLRQCGVGQAKVLSPLAIACEAGMGARTLPAIFLHSPLPLPSPGRGGS